MDAREVASAASTHESVAVAMVIHETILPRRSDNTFAFLVGVAVAMVWVVFSWERDCQLRGLSRSASRTRGDRQLLSGGRVFSVWM